MRFLFHEQREILRLLILTAAVSFFVVGVANIGLPYIIRNILGLGAGYYGAAESILGAAAILGSLAAGCLSAKLKIRKLYLVLASMGVALLPAGITFLLPAGIWGRYGAVILSFCLIQFAACVFSVFALSLIQQKTPNELLGKTMAYIATITMCAHPLGQILFGILFDRFHSQIYIVLLSCAVIIIFMGLFTRSVFRRLDTSTCQ